MKKIIIYTFLLFHCLILKAQKPYVSSFVDSISVSLTYNPLKIDSILITPQPLKAEWYSSVLQLEKDKKFDQAYTLFEPKKNTDPIAMYLLGKYFYFSLSKATPKDKNSAYLWFFKASQANFTPAFEAMAKMDFEGDSRAFSDSLAINHLRTAIANGSKKSYGSLGYIFQLGKSKKNLDSALYWYQKAILEKDISAIYNTGTIYESKKFYEMMLAKYNEAAQKNLGISFRRLGELYYKGLGVSQDDANAKSYFEKAYSLGEIGASNLLGVLEAKDKKFEKAFEYFQISSRNGDSYGKYNTAVCLSEGFGIVSNVVKAFNLYKLVADEIVEAKNNIGTLYERNLVEKGGIKEAQKFYENAADGGSIFGMMNLGRVLAKTDRALATKWMEKAANTNNLSAVMLYIKYTRAISTTKAIQLAERFAQSSDKSVQKTGLRVAGDLNRQRADSLKKATTEKNKIAADLSQKFALKAIEWYTKAASIDDDSSMVRLGQMYYVGNLVMKNYEKAQEHWRNAADLGNATAMYNLAYFYEKDTTVFRTRKLDKAIEFYKKTINAPNASNEIKRDAGFRLGNLYQYTNTKEFEKNSREAIRWYQVAADLGDSDAMYEIGFIYENGIQNSKPENSIKMNREEAKKWYKRAAILKNEDALKALKRMGE